MEKISELGNNLEKSVKINVEKNNGIRERFSYEKLMKSLIMVETPFFESDKIIATVVSQLYDGIKTKEIKKIVYECLEDIDPEIANKYLASTQLKVRTSRDTIEAFDLSKIANTLIEETGASQETAFEIGRGLLLDEPGTLNAPLGFIDDMKKYAEYMRNQVTELLTNYGKIDIMWFDYSYNQPNAYRPPTAQEWMKGKGKDDWESEKMIEMIKHYVDEI